MRHEAQVGGLALGLAKARGGQGVMARPEGGHEAWVWPKLEEGGDGSPHQGEGEEWGWLVRGEGDPNPPYRNTNRGPMRCCSVPCWD